MPTSRPLAKARGWARPPNTLVAAVAITVAAVALYVRPIFELGFYYDDWLMLSALQDWPSQTLPGLFDACRTVEPAGRPGTCMYHASANWILGDSPAAYHVLSIVFLVACSTLLYALLRRLQFGHWAALLACLLFIVYPGSDSTRLWPTGAGAQYILGVYFGAVLLAIEGLRREGWRALALHLASFALFVLLVFTYEAVLVLIGLAAGLYLLATPRTRRAALWRGALDLTLAGVFVFYRAVVDPVDASTGFTQSRTAAETIDRVQAVLKGAWNSWEPLFLPGTAAMVIVVAAVLLWLTAMADDRAVRRASLRWLIAAAVATIFAVASVLPYVAGNDLYVPDTYSLFNRLNFAAAAPYCVVFVALCGLLWTTLTHWFVRPLAAAVVAALALGVAISQIGVNLDSQEVWAASWDDQQAAIAVLHRVTPRPDPDASIMSFGHPIWERGYIPVFSSSWDLRGVMDAESPIDPLFALPFLDAATCGPGGVLLGGAPYAAYRGAVPLWFVNLSSGEARHITSARACGGAVDEWGRPPFWGKTVKGY